LTFGARARITWPMTKPWPLGLNRQNAIWYALGFVALILALHLVDRIALDCCDRGTDIRPFFRALTMLGESQYVLGPSLLAVLMAWLVSLATGDRVRQWARLVLKLSGFIFLGVGVPGIVATLAKRAIGRARPIEWTAEAQLSFQPFNWSAYSYQSFPSGHATTAFGFAIIIAFLWPRTLWPMLVLAVLIAVSRVVLGQHYPTDIAAGAVLGTLGAYAVRNFFAARGWLFQRNEAREIIRLPLRPN
jgi:membrane-associated phospholipid phosphatase